MSTFLEIALSCVARGWHVHPLKPAGKIPITAHGKNDATVSEAQVREWWTHNPNCNVGISCGASGLCVLDADHGLRDEKDFKAWRGRNGLPVTYAVRSGRRDDYGVQSYYLGTLADGRFELDGVKGDIKSAGGLVLAAGDIHPVTGEAYYVLVDAPLAPVPAVVDQSRVRQQVSAALDGGYITENRNLAMTSILGKMREAGLSDELLRDYAIRTNEARMKPPLDEDELEGIIHNACKWPLPAPEPVAVIGTSSESKCLEAAKLPDRVRPEYPTIAWEGTVVAEFAKLCAGDNNIPRKMYAEAFRCALGAVVGDRISCPGVDGALPRSYTVIVAPKGKGKGTAIRRAVKFFSQPWYGMRSTPGLIIQGDSSGLLSGERDFVWKPKGIGAWIAAASSVPGMARLTKDLESTIKNKPHMTWGSTLPRILSVHEEMKTFLSTLFIEGGVGSGMEGVVCQLWDDVTFHGTATGTRDAAYGEMMFSMLCGVTEQDWFDLLSRGNAVGSGLMSRFNMIGTEGEFENVSRMHPPDFTALQETFLPRVIQLEDAHARVRPTEAADTIISEWADNLPEGSERMNIHAWRSALLLAWLRHEEAITAKTAEDAVRLGEYQVTSHDYYRTKSADTANARVQARLLRALEMKGPLFKRDLQRYTHAHRDGTELWNRALAGLLHDKAVGQREDGAYFRAE